VSGGAIAENAVARVGVGPVEFADGTKGKGNSAMTAAAFA